MGANRCQVLLWLVFMVPIESQDQMDSFDTLNAVDPQEFRYSLLKGVSERKGDAACLAVRPRAGEIVQRLYAVLPYFDKEHANADFLHRMRGTINSMADGSDALDREMAYFASVLVPVVFLQSYQDTWCLLERFHRAIRFYQMSHPTDKRSSLKLLQNLRSVMNKITVFVHELRGPQPLSQEQVLTDQEATTPPSRKNIRFVKELIKNLGGLDSPLCRTCMDAEGTATHVLVECAGVARQRAALLGNLGTFGEACGDIRKLLAFLAELGWQESMKPSQYAK